MEAGDKRWLPEPEEGAGTDYPPWVPETLQGALSEEELPGYAYVVVDEIVGHGLGLSVSPWPGVDELGRVRFADSGEAGLLGAERTNFQQFVNASRVVMVKADPAALEEAAQALQKRELRIGHAFAIPRAAIEAAREGEGTRFAPGEGVRVYDITFEARTEAKLAMAAALAPPLTEKEAERLTEGAEPEAPPSAGAEMPEQTLGVDPEGAVRPPEELGEPKA